jgi:hypothetical protein
VRLRITDYEPAPSPVLEWPDIRYTAGVLNVLKQYPTAGSTGATLKFVQAQTYEEAGPHAIGTEFVMFLRWQSTQDAFGRVGSNFGAAGTFAIQTDSSRVPG